MLAVSGGVDSMALLHMLTKQKNLKVIVAHYDHGIREDSLVDRQLVQTAAKQYGVPFVFDEGHLGADTSEAAARDARYKFLKTVTSACNAKAIITAHHQDDLIETAIINLLRGTNRKGISSLKSSGDLLRPLLNFTKEEIVKYAKTNKLKWRDDITNDDEKYLRNYVRKNLIPKLSEAHKGNFVKLIDDVAKLNKEIDAIIDRQAGPGSTVDRHWFVMLDHNVARDVMATWLRANGATFDKKKLEQAVIAGKTLAPQKQLDIDGNHKLVVEKENLALKP